MQRLQAVRHFFQFIGSKVTKNEIEEKERAPRFQFVNLKRNGKSVCCLLTTMSSPKPRAVCKERGLIDVPPSRYSRYKAVKFPLRKSLLVCLYSSLLSSSCNNCYKLTFDIRNFWLMFKVCYVYTYLVEYFSPTTRYCFRRVSCGTVTRKCSCSIQFTFINFVISLETKEWKHDYAGPQRGCAVRQCDHDSVHITVVLGRVSTGKEG